MNKRALITAFVIAALALGFSLLFGPARPSARVSTYQNAEHGYSLSYPAKLDVREYTPDFVSFGHEDGEAMEAVAEASVYVVQGEPGEAFIDAVARYMAMLCAADGPRSSFSCVGSEQVQPFSSASGAQGYSFYLKGELTDLQTGEVAERGRGPYFAFPLTTGALATRTLIVHAPVAFEADAVDSETIRAIAESVVLRSEVVPGEDAGGLSAQMSALSAYMSEHIERLSSAKAVLGGKFYVTNIEAHGGAGTVWYEDGHVAHVADFTYSFDEEGIVSVDSFKVR